MIEDNQLISFVLFQKRIEANFRKIEYMRIYNQREDRKELNRINNRRYLHTEKGRKIKAEQLKRYKKSGKYKEWQRKYFNKPDVREKLNAYQREYKKKHRGTFEERHLKKLNDVLTEINNNITYDVNQPMPPREIKRNYTPRFFLTLQNIEARVRSFFYLIDTIESFIKV